MSGVFGTSLMSIVVAYGSTIRSMGDTSRAHWKTDSGSGSAPSPGGLSASGLTVAACVNRNGISLIANLSFVWQLPVKHGVHLFGWFTDPGSFADTTGPDDPIWLVSSSACNLMRPRVQALGRTNV